MFLNISLDQLVLTSPNMETTKYYKYTDVHDSF